MELIREELRETVREGYQVLLRAQAELFLPVGEEKIAAYYRSLGRLCLDWNVDVWGAELQRAFAALSDVREKARFGVRYYRISVRCVHQGDGLAVFVCDAERMSVKEGEGDHRRLAQVWNTAEQTLLPRRQAERAFDAARYARRVQFRPDGVYAQGEELVFFKNATPATPFAEQKIPIERGKNDTNGEFDKNIT